MSDQIDPITLAVLAGRMEQIADEMDATLFRAAFNPIIAEAHDASHGLYHATSGDTLVQGKSGLPIFVGVMSFAVKAVIDKAAEAGDLADGDIYIFNDAHMGGTHLSDMRLVRPYFRDGELFCYLASVGHWHDVGGAVPGNYNPSATEAFQEAFVLPPVKLARKGEIQQDIIDILLRNTRLPQSAMGDLNGQLGALDLGVKRLDELLENLQRNELTRLERCLFVAEYRRLIQQSRPETRRGGDRKSGDFHQSAVDGTLTSWWDDLAVRSDRSRRTIMREASVGEKLDPVAVSKLSASPVADNLGELEVLSKFDGTKQSQIADVLVATNAPVPTVGAAIRAMEKGGDPEEAEGPDDLAYNKLLWHCPGVGWPWWPGFFAA